MHGKNHSPKRSSGFAFSDIQTVFCALKNYSNFDISLPENVLQYRYFINEERKYGKMSKIVIMESLGISAEELAARKKPFEEKGHTFACFPRTTDIPTLIEEAKDADAMIIANMPMPGEVIRSCKNLKFI